MKKKPKCFACGSTDKSQLYRYYERVDLVMVSRAIRLCEECNLRRSHLDAIKSDDNLINFNNMMRVKHRIRE